MGRGNKTVHRKIEDPRSWESVLRRLKRKAEAGLLPSDDFIRVRPHTDGFETLGKRETPSSMCLPCMEKYVLLYGVVLYDKPPNEKDKNNKKLLYQKRKNVVLRSIRETLLLLNSGETFFIAANKSIGIDIVREVENECNNRKINLKIFRSSTDKVDPGRQRALLAREMVKYDNDALYVISDARRIIREKGVEGEHQNPMKIRELIFDGHQSGKCGSPESWQTSTGTGVPLQTFILDSKVIQSYPNLFRPGYLFEDFASLVDKRMYINAYLKRLAYPAPSLLRSKESLFPPVWENEGAMNDIIKNVLHLIRSNNLVAKNGKVRFNFPTYEMTFDASFRLHMLVLVACHYAGIFADVEFDLKLQESFDQKNFSRKQKSAWEILKKKKPHSSDAFTQKEVCDAIREVVRLIRKDILVESARIVNTVGKTAIVESSRMPMNLKKA